MKESFIPQLKQEMTLFSLIEIKNQRNEAKDK
jgi:hypothetical protein